MRHLLVILLFLTSLAGDCAAASPDYSKLILGAWAGRRICVFHTDGTWGVRKWDDRPEDVRGRRWHIEADKLTLIYPGDHGFESSVYTIVSLTSDRLVTETQGYREEYKRVQRPPETPNHSMQPTPGRRTLKISMTQTSHPAATRALASGG